jgi:hypothetical protein
MASVASSGPSQHVQIFHNNPWVLFLSLPNGTTSGSHDLTNKIVRTDKSPFAGGGYADVYRAIYIDDSGRVKEVLYTLIFSPFDLR